MILLILEYCKFFFSVITSILLNNSDTSFDIYFAAQLENDIPVFSCNPIEVKSIELI